MYFARRKEHVEMKRECKVEYYYEIVLVGGCRSFKNLSQNSQKVNMHV